MTVGTRPTIPAERYAERIDRLTTLAATGGLDAVLIAVGPDLEYLTGYRATPMERLTMLVLIPGRDPVLVVPRLERAAAEAELRVPVEIRTWAESDDPYALVLTDVTTARGRSTVVAVSERLWASHLLQLQRRLADGDGGAGAGAGHAAASSEFRSVAPVLAELRMIKDPDEIALLRLAAQAADRVVARIASGRLVGRTEADVAREVREQLIVEGHETAQFAIVGSGPNSASPHHEASERVIQAGEPIVLDIGGTLGGYGSDITRTLWVTGGDPAKGPDEAFRHLFGILRDGQAAATAAVRPGVACGAIDGVARRRIDGEGFAEAFFHRTGHGIGLEGHEEPYMIAGNDLPLRPGMAFSVEPGIYLAGVYGARIEDIVVCGEDGPIVLNEAPRELYVVDG